MSLELDNVSMAYGRRVLFQNVFASIESGEVLVVTGANGTGKSTLLKILAGLVRPQTGRIVRDARVPFGYAAPDVQLYAELTGSENLDFFRSLRGLPPSDFVTLLERVGLPTARGADRVSEYSSGMRQRLKLAVSLLGRPSVLLWDEPTLALDEAGGRQVDVIIREHRQSGGLSVLSTNNPAEAERWADLRLDLGPILPSVA